MTTLVLLSGGLDSAVLAAHEAQTSRVLPVYVCVGLAWEAAELTMIARLLHAPVFAGRVEPLIQVECTMRDVYSPTSWMTISRRRGWVSSSSSTICCHVPSISRPAVNGIATEGPTSAART